MPVRLDARAVGVLLLLTVAGVVCAESNIEPAHKYVWCENIGWTNWLDADGGSNGVKVSDSYLSGFIWAENAGWVNAGDGSPADGVHYANADDSDFGVNLASDDGLYGYAWGENVGWLNFDTASLGSEKARLDVCTKRFYGYAWGENIGWLNLGDPVYFLAATLEADCNTNGIEDACDVDEGTSADCNSNSVPDECEPDFDGDGLIDACDPDIDNDGVPNEADVCDATPPSLPLQYVEPDGSVKGDLDGDCDVDLADFAMMQERFTGPNP